MARCKAAPIHGARALPRAIESLEPGMQPLSITVVGAGITGLWQALTLARRGRRVRLIERSAEPFAQAASAFAGAMLAPYCEVEAAELVVRDLGLRSLAIWRETYPSVTVKGTLVVAGTRDRADLVRFARMTEGFDQLDAEQLNAQEPGWRGASPPASTTRKRGTWLRRAPWPFSSTPQSGRASR